MKTIIAVLILLFAGCDAIGGDPSTPPAVVAAVKSEIAKAAKPQLIVFTAVEWCAPCKVYEKEIRRLEAMTYKTKDGKTHRWAENIGEDPEDAIQIIDYSDEATQKLMRERCVEQLPTTIRLDENGKEESRFSGVLTAEQLCLYQAGKWSPPNDRK